MASELLFDYDLRITGKIRAVDRQAAEQKLRMFVSIPLGIHEGVEDVVVRVQPNELEDMEGRFRG